MPRLVSLTLLSVLVLPAAGLVYLVTVVLGNRILGHWRYENLLFMIANVLSFGLVIIWWLLLWGRAARWTSSAGRLALATAGCILLGVVTGFLVQFPFRDAGFGVFVGGATTIIAWLVATCLIWRNPSASMTFRSAEAPAEDSVLCPTCGYALNGLREARCPECGQAYTLDELMRAQRSFSSQEKDLAT